MKESQSRQFFFLLRQLTGRELKRKYARSYLGVIWSVLHPLLSMVILSLIFSQLFRRTIDHYPIYYLTGYILWQAFTGATNASITTLADNKALLLKIHFPIELFVLARVYTAFVQLGYSLIAYGTMLALFRIPLQWSMLIAPLLILFLFGFALGISYLLSAAYLFFGDIKYLYSVALTLWMYCSAIFYPVDQLEGPIRWIIEENPLFLFISTMRNAVLSGLWPDPKTSLRMLLWGGGTYLLGSLLFRKNKSRMMQNL